MSSLHTECPQLATPPNGMVTWNSLVVGGVTTYTCADGFELVGSMTRTCQSNDTWSEEEPMCRGILLGSDFLYIYSIRQKKLSIPLEINAV